jgi:hypothetical protein
MIKSSIMNPHCPKASFATRRLPRKHRPSKSPGMRYFLFLPLCLAACTVPGANTFAPAPVGADTSSIAATAAFAGRIPLVTILPGTTDFAAPVAGAVRQALAIKPTAAFDVEAQSPAAATPDASAAALTSLSATAAAVAKSIVADGVDPARVQVTAKTAGLDADILVYVK